LGVTREKAWVYKSTRSTGWQPSS
jgi:hypothetical protein